MGSQHLQTTATVRKVATKGRKQLYGKPAFADNSNSREGSDKGEQTTVWEAAFAKDDSTKEVSQQRTDFSI